MKRKTKRFFSIVLVACMLFSLIPLNAIESLEDDERYVQENVETESSSNNSIISRAASWHTITLHPASTYSSSLTAKVKIGDFVNGYQVTSVVGTDIKVRVYGNYNDIFSLPKASELWYNAKISDYVVWTGIGSANKKEGENVLLPMSDASAYYYFNTANSVIGDEEYYWNFTLKYNANGGTGAPDNQTGGHNDKYKRYFTFKISNIKPTRYGYTFLGWARTSNATEPEYFPDGTYIMWNQTNEYNGGSKTEIFYAVWQLSPIDNGNGISITKTRVSINNDTKKTSAEPGDEIKWEITVTNNSNVTKAITLEEELPGVSLGEDNFSLAAGESKTVTATYIVEQADIGTTVYNTVIAKTDKETEEDTDEGTLIPISVKFPVPYRVEWYDKQGHSIKKTSYRTGYEDNTVTPTDEDYVIDGWIFDEIDSKNILSKQLKENEENVLKLYFYKVVPTVNLSFEKNIDEKSDCFEKLKLNNDESYNFFISLTNQETGEVINGLLDSKEGFRVNNIPIGTYIIEEQNDILFRFVSMALMEPIEGIEFKEENGNYIIIIGASVESGATANIEVTNKPDEERFYDNKYDIKNLFNITM